MWENGEKCQAVFPKADALNLRPQPKDIQLYFIKDERNLKKRI